MRALILLALLGAAVALPKNGQRIVGGEATTVEAYPYMSNMQYNTMGLGWYQACGGSLINQQSVLSAVHCYDGDGPSEWRVRLGSSFNSSGGTVYAVSQLILHPQYNSSTFDSDIAIVRLASLAVYSNLVGPAGIAGPNYNLADGTVITALGWGSLSSGGPPSEQLQRVDINIISHAYCFERYAWLRTQPGFEDWADITDNMLCAGIQYVGGRDTCLRDSGGPLAHNSNVIVGITSYGYGCAEAEFPGVYTRVSNFTDWIIANA